VAETHSQKRLMGYVRVSAYGQALDSELERFAPPDVAAGTPNPRR
jgi:hypothetical protein